MKPFDLVGSGFFEITINEPIKPALPYFGALADFTRGKFRFFSETLGLVYKVCHIP